MPKLLEIEGLVFDKLRMTGKWGWTAYQATLKFDCPECGIHYLIPRRGYGWPKRLLVKLECNHGKVFIVPFASQKEEIERQMDAARAEYYKADELANKEKLHDQQWATERRRLESLYGCDLNTEGYVDIKEQ